MEVILSYGFALLPSSSLCYVSETFENLLRRSFSTACQNLQLSVIGNDIASDLKVIIFPNKARFSWPQYLFSFILASMRSSLCFVLTDDYFVCLIWYLILQLLTGYTTASQWITKQGLCYAPAAFPGFSLFSRFTTLFTIGMCQTTSCSLHHSHTTFSVLKSLPYLRFSHPENLLNWKQNFLQSC